MRPTSRSKVPFRQNSRITRPYPEKECQKVWDELGVGATEFLSTRSATRRLQEWGQEESLDLAQLRGFLEHPDEQVPITLCRRFQEVLATGGRLSDKPYSVYSLTGFLLKRRIQNTHREENIAWSPLMDAYTTEHIETFLLDHHSFDGENKHLVEDALWELGKWLPEAPADQVQQLLDFQSMRLWKLVGRKAALSSPVWEKLKTRSGLDDHNTPQTGSYQGQKGELLGKIARNPTLTAQQIRQIYQANVKWIGVHMALIDHSNTPQNLRLRFLDRLGAWENPSDVGAIEEILDMETVRHNRSCWKQLARSLTRWNQLRVLLEHHDRKATHKIIAQACRHHPDSLVEWLNQHAQTADLGSRAWSQILGQLDPELRQRVFRIAGQATNIDGRSAKER